jgi:hypothetical protein
MKEPGNSPIKPGQPSAGDARTEGKWLESLEDVVEHALRNQGPETAARFLGNLTGRLRAGGA